MSFVRKFGAFAGNAARAGVSAYMGMGNLANQTNQTNAQVGQMNAQTAAMKDYANFMKGWLKNMGVKGAETIDFGDRAADPAYQPTPSITGAVSKAAQAPIPGMAPPRQLATPPMFPPQPDEEY